MDLNAILSDKPIPPRSEPVETESVTDDKPEAVEATPEPAASSAAKEPEKQAEPATEQPTDQARERDDKGRFKKTVPQEALHAERMKRQELEQKLREIESQKPKTSVLENEDQAFQERVSELTRPLQERFFKLSVKAARNTPGREDYEEVTQAFAEAAEADPKLWESFRASDDPGEYAYTVGKQIKELGDVGGDILKYGEKKRAEGAAEVESLKTQLKALQAEMETLKKSKEQRDKIPQSLNSEPSATANGNGTYAGPTSIKSIFT